MPNPDISALPRWSDENNTTLLAERVVGAKLFNSKLIKVYDGVKDRKKMNYFGDTQFYQLGNCVTIASGYTDFTQRYVEVTQYTDRREWCFDEWNEVYLSALLDKGSDTATPADFPEVLYDHIVSTTAKDIEHCAWMGGISSGNGLLDHTDGWLALLTDSATIYSAHTSTTSAFTAVTVSNVEDIIAEMMDNIAPQIAAMNLVLHCPMNVFNIIKRACHANYAFNFSSSDAESFVHPIFGNVTVRVEPNMTGAQQFLITIPGNLVYACDAYDEADILKIEEKANVANMLVIQNKFKIGFDIAFPEYIAMFDWS